jgi:uncharacterized protein
MATRYVPCPSCRGDAEYSEANPSRPFCSPRCRQLDFGAWASEQFRLPVVDAKDDEMSDGPKPDLH